VLLGLGLGFGLGLGPGFAFRRDADAERPPSEAATPPGAIVDYADRLLLPRKQDQSVAAILSAQSKASSHSASVTYPAAIAT
jgi:hypothetical protein